MKKYTAYIYAPVVDIDNPRKIVSFRRGRFDGYKVETQRGPLFIANTANKKHNKSSCLYTVSDLETGAALGQWLPTIQAAIDKGRRAFLDWGDNLPAARLETQQLIKKLPVKDI